jgi:hypothetical protein
MRRKIAVPGWKLGWKLNSVNNKDLDISIQVLVVFGGDDPAP